MFVYLLAVVAASIMAMKAQPFPLPRLKKTTLILGLVWAVSFGISLSQKNDRFFSEAALDRMSFVVISLFAYLNFCRLSQKQINTTDLIALPVIFSGLLVAGYGWFQYLFQRSLNPQEIDYFSFSSTFGHINMTSQFLGISILFHLDRAVRSNKRSRWICLISAALCFSFVLLAQNRSAILGIGVGAFLIFLNQVKTRKLVLLAWITLICVATGYLSVQPQKLGNSKYRLGMMQASLAMIQDHPLGIGSGRFEFESLPYRQQTLAPANEPYLDHSPHNEFLRILVEEGIVYFILILWIAVQVLSPLLKSREGPWLGVVAFLIVEMLFQFPLENAYPFLIASIITGYSLFLRTSAQSQSQSLNWKYRALLAIAGIYIALGAALKLGANYTVKNSSRQAPFFCQYYPSSWQSCLLDASLKAGQKDFPASQRILSSLLTQSRYNYPAIRLWSQVSRDQGDMTEACYALWLYDWIFLNRSSMNEIKAAFCPKDLLQSLDQDPASIFTKSKMFTSPSIP